jgi:hypothetical protein
MRKMLAATGGHYWVEVLGDILVGIRLLPTRCGWSPFTLVYKQEPYWLPEAMGATPADDGDLPAEADIEPYLAAVTTWWDQVEVEVRRRHNKNDQAMKRTYEKRTDLSKVDLRSTLVPGAQVVMRQI